MNSRTCVAVGIDLIVGHLQLWHPNCNFEICDGWLVVDTSTRFNVRNCLTNSPSHADKPLWLELADSISASIRCLTPIELGQIGDNNAATATAI